MDCAGGRLVRRDRLMKAIAILVLSILAAIRPAEAASPTLNPLEIPEYVREWFSGHDFTGKPKVTGKYHQ